MRARQRVDVRRESPVVGVSFLPLNMVRLTVVSLHIFALLHYVQTSAWTWQRADRGLEVSFTGSSLCHFTSSLLSLVVEIELILFCP